MKIKSLVILCALFISQTFFIISPVRALDPTSMRIKALGENTQGLISDTYTDLLANPARQRLLPANNAIIKIGSNGNPITLAYNTSPAFVLVEGRIQHSAFGNDQLTSNFTNSNFFLEQQSINKATYDNSDINAVGLLGFGSERFGYGLGLYYQYTDVTNFSNSTLNKRYKNTSSLTTTGITDSTSTLDGKTALQNPSLVFGLHWKGEDDRYSEKDLIMKLLFSKSTSRKNTETSQFTNNDPDQDGLDISGTAISTPSTSNNMFSSINESNPSYKAGAGFEYHLRNISNDAERGFLFSFTWQPTDVPNNLTERSSFQTVSGSTSTTTANSRQILSDGDGNTFTSVIGIGGIKKLNNRLGLGLAVRATTVYTKTDRTMSDYVGNTLISQRDISEQSFTNGLNTPLFAEVYITHSLTLRGNVTGSWNYSNSKEDVANAFFAPETLKSSNYSTGSNYGLGLGYVWRNLIVDLFSTSNIFDTTNLGMQLSYIFGGSKTE